MDGTATAELREVRELLLEHHRAGRELALRRDRAIAAALRGGATLARIAAELGVSRQAVSRHVPTEGRQA